MPLFDARDILAFPGGDNATDTVIGNIHLNLTTLKHWNYTYYSNGTLSNGSWCLLTFEPYQPALVFPNGTFLNVTWCWSPTEPIGVRAGIAIGYAILFGLALILTMVNLTKHGKLHLPAEKRFFPIGRRWQWYWAAWVCATAMISLLTTVDVDRYFLPELPIILTSFFWYLMQMGAIAVVWEAVRHWGSWMERQFIDPDPFVLREDDKRAQVELYVPLFFYLFLWLNFFMIVPRNWSKIEHQRYPEQIITDAAPTATDARFKTAAFLLAVCWLITAFSLRHSIKYYCPRNRGLFNRIRGFIRYMPLRFKLLLPLAAVIPAYQALVAWHFDYSPLRVNGSNKASIFAGGYTPALLILYVQAIIGFFNPNEDLELQRQRRVRTQALNQEIGIVVKPSWWRRNNGEIMDPNENMRDQLLRNVREINGNKAVDPATAEAATLTTIDESGKPIEMGPVSPTLVSSGLSGPQLTPYTGQSDRRRGERNLELAAGLLFPDGAKSAAANAARRRAELMQDGPAPPPYLDNNAGSGSRSVTRSVSAQSEGSTNQPPQVIKSMLDV